MNIVVIDGYTLNPGDLTWGKISSLGNLTVNDRTPSELIIEKCKEADIVLTNKVPFTKETISKLPNLKMIGVLATGYNVIDTEAAKEKGIIVCNVPAYGTASVAQHVFALLLELTNHVGQNAGATKEGKWTNSLDWSFTESPITELAGKVFGIVGFGNIGQNSARIARALGMKVIYNSRTPKETDLGEYKELKELFAKSDVLSLHCPLTGKNKEFINRDLLQIMKKTALLINTARGQLINEQDLANALNNNTIGGAGIDVLSTEPPLATNPLLTAKNCIITPHNAWMSREARERIMNVTSENIKAFIYNNPINKVN